ncbi:MAG: GDP-mannose 4,6-dehydratase [Acidimicrobiales bacterium]
MRTFVTGASGFVGTWLTRHLEACGDEVYPLRDEFDIADERAVGREASRAAPDVIYHLAGLPHVGRSWEAPAETFRVNALGTLVLLEVARKLVPRPRVVLVSSAEVYGIAGSAALDEDTPLRPVSPYAASKVAAEYVGLQAFLGRGLEVVRVRPFNHVGPGQADSFVVSALARRVVEAERAGSGEVRVGNLTAARDFTDVRDVVRAYRLLAELGAGGAVYNVCSGCAVPIATILAEILSLAQRPLVPVEDPALVRPIDLPTLLGDGSRLAALTGWKPEIPLRQTLVDVMRATREGV